MTAWTDDLPDLSAGDFATDTALISKILGALHALTDTWEDYTSTWSTSGSAPSLGSGDLTANYTVARTLGLFFLRLVFAADTNPGTGEWNFTNPFVPNNSDVYMGGYVYDDSVGQEYPVASRWQTGQPRIVRISGHTATGTIGKVGATHPFTWATNDRMALLGVVQVA